MKRIVMCLLFVQFGLFAAPVGQTSDKFLAEALEFINGDKGVTLVTKTMPSCPYEKCSEVENKDGTKTFSYPKKDLHRATVLLKSSLDKYENPMAAKEMVKLLQRRLNWKESTPDKYLLSQLRDDVGMGYQEFQQYFLKAIDVLSKNNNCDGYLLKAEINEKGYLKTPVDLVSAKNNYMKASQTCGKDSYNGLIAIQKIKTFAANQKGR